MLNKPPHERVNRSKGLCCRQRTFVNDGAGAQHTTTSLPSHCNYYRASRAIFFTDISDNKEEHGRSIEDK